MNERPAHKNPKYKALHSNNSKQRKGGKPIPENKELTWVLAAWERVRGYGVVSREDSRGDRNRKEGLPFQFR